MSVGPYRVTQRGVAMQSLANLQGNLDRLSSIQNQLSSGKQVQRPSDDPSMAVVAMRARAESSVYTQYSRAADDAQGWLSTIDNTMSGMTAALRRVRDLTVQGASTAVQDQTSRDAIAAEIDQVKQSLIESSNAKYNNRPVFGGVTAGTSAYDATGNYVGVSVAAGGPIQRRVSEGSLVRVDVTGPEAFGAPGSDMFSVLSQISSDLRTNPSNVSNDLGTVDNTVNNLLNVQADIGARANRVTAMQTAATARIGVLNTQQSDAEDIDLPKTIINLNMAQVAYQSALQATAKVIQPSLMDFLR